MLWNSIMNTFFFYKNKLTISLKEAEDFLKVKGKQYNDCTVPSFYTQILSFAQLLGCISTDENVI